MTAAEPIAPLEIGDWHIHGGWWTVGLVVAFAALGAVLLGLTVDFELRRRQLHDLEDRLATLEQALTVPQAVTDALADADTGEIAVTEPATAPIPAQPPPAPGPATTPAAEAIDAGHRKLVATEQREYLGMKFNFRA